MEHHDLIQGSPEWLAYRATCFNASDAPAMLGVSSYKTRAQLLRELATGLTEEVTPAQQRRFDDGHRFEELARPLGESIIGEELYRVTGSEAFEGIGRRLSASFDGITMLEGDAWEHKSLNDRLRAALPEQGIGDGRALPVEYRAQMEQQLLVSGAGRVLFTASKWSNSELIEARHAWYESDPALREQLLAGWAQFERDLAQWQPAEAAPTKPAARTMETLPALRIQASGSITASNLAEFKSHALECIRGINRELTTDQEFADAEAAAKWCGKVEESMAEAERSLLAQTADISDAVNTLRELAEEARKVRLALTKDVTAKKEQLKTERIHAAMRELATHVTTLQAKLPGGIRMLAPAADFAAVIKGKRTLTSIDDAIATLLANAKASATVQLANIEANLAQLESLGATASLLPDLSQLAQRLPDDFAAIVRGRVAQALAEQQAREAHEALTKARAEAEAAAAAAIAAAQAKAPPPAEPVRIAPTSAPGAIVPLLKLSEVQAAIGLQVSAAELAGLGFEAELRGAAKCYRRDQLPAICRQLIANLQRVIADLEATA